MVATPSGRILVRAPTLLIGYLILAQNRPLIGIMPVILVKLIMVCSGSGVLRRWRWC